MKNKLFKSSLFLIYMSLVLCLFSCRTTSSIIEVPVEKTKIEYKANTIRDSIYLHDSISIYQKGDTIYTTKYKYAFKYVNIKDTVLKIDSIPKFYRITTTKIQEVNKLLWYQKALMGVGGVALIILITLIGYKYIRLKI